MFTLSSGDRPGQYRIEIMWHGPEYANRLRVQNRFRGRSEKGAADFSLSMNQSVDTQEASLLKQMDKSPESTKAILGEVKSFRECVIAQSSALRPATRLDLLEQCRVNMQNRISPPGNVSYGMLRYWNQRPNDPRYTYDTPIMGGFLIMGARVPRLSPMRYSKWKTSGRHSYRQSMIAGSTLRRVCPRVCLTDTLPLEPL